jgi:hypothetical protein
MRSYFQPPIFYPPQEKTKTKTENNQHLGKPREKKKQNKIAKCSRSEDSKEGCC